VAIGRVPRKYEPVSVCDCASKQTSTSDDEVKPNGSRRVLGKVVHMQGM